MRQIQPELEELDRFFKSMVPEGHCAHYQIKGTSAPIMVWGEASDAYDKYGDDGMDYQTIQGRLYYETDRDFDPVFDQIQEALDLKMDTWRWTESYYNPENDLIRHCWIWAVECA